MKRLLLSQVCSNMLRNSDAINTTGIEALYHDRPCAYFVSLNWLPPDTPTNRIFNLLASNSREVRDRLKPDKALIVLKKEHSSKSGPWIPRFAIVHPEMFQQIQQQREEVA